MTTLNDILRDVHREVNALKAPDADSFFHQAGHIISEMFDVEGSMTAYEMTGQPGNFMLGVYINHVRSGEKKLLCLVWDEEEQIGSAVPEDEMAGNHLTFLKTMLGIHSAIMDKASGLSL